MTLQRLTRNHHNMRKRHLVIGDAVAVILALRKGQSLHFVAQRRPTFQLHSVKSHIDGA